MTDQLSKLADGLFAAVTGYVARGLETIARRVAVLEQRTPERGADGKDGKSIDPAEVEQMVQRAAEALPKPANGKDADAAAIARDVLEQVSKVLDAIPVPRDGRDGADADPELIARLVEAAVEKAMAAIPTPVNGKDADPDFIRAEVQKAVDAIPRPKDGKDGLNGLDGALGVGLPGKDGRDGEDGRDALQIDILPGIDETRSYPRGTYANWRGGVIRSIRTTEPITGRPEEAGWVVDRDGEYEFDVEQINERTFSVKRSFTSGRVHEKRFSMPVQIFRGAYVEGKTYDRGDTATWAGSQWHCNKDGTTEKPGLSSAWTLSVKRGHNGKDGALPPAPPATVKLGT